MFSHYHRAFQCALIIGILCLSAAPVPLWAQEAVAFHIVRNDSRLDELISPDAKLELVGDRFGLTEGPVWVPNDSEGFLLFSDLISNVIYRWAPGEKISAYLERSGYSGDDITSAGYQTRRGRMAVLLIGPNGLFLDAEGRLIYLATPDRAVMRLESDGSRTVIADRWQGRRFNGPNDLTINSKGWIYLTDSVWGIRDGLANPDSQMDFSGIFLIKDSETTLIYSDSDHPGGWPNGVTLSPDGTRLGVLALPQPAGEPQQQVCATNVAFGDNDSRMLYITACEHVYRIRMRVPGVHPQSN